jgi:hypothetical protein
MYFIHSNVYNSIQEPSITEIMPDYGPQVGGTLVTLTGPHLNAGMIKTVSIGDQDCPIKR